MLRLESFQYLIPTTRHRKHLNLPLPSRVNPEMKAVCQFAVGIVFGKDQDVW